MAFEQLEFDESNILDGLSKIADRMTTIEELTAKLEKTIETTFGSLVNGANEADDAFGKAKSGADKLGDATKEAAKGTKDMKDAVGELAGGMRVFGVNVGSSVQQLKAKAGALKTVVSGLGSGSTALKVFKVALASTGIGVIVLALGALISYFGTAEKATNKVNIVLAALGAIVTTVFNTVGKLGGAVIKVFKGDFSGAFKDAKGAVTGFNDELKKSITTMTQLEARTQALKDRQREAAVTTSEVRKQINELNLTASDTTKSFKERQAAQEKLGALEKQLLTENIALRQEELDIIQEKNKANPFFADLQAEADAQVALNEIQTESFSNQKKQQVALNNLRDEEKAKIAAAVEKQKELRAEVQGMVEDFINAAAKVERDKLSPEDRLKAEADLAKKLINVQFDNIKAKAKAAGIEIDLEKEKAAIIEGIDLETATKTLEIQRKAQDDKIQAAKDYYDAALNDHLNFSALMADQEAKRAKDTSDDIANITKNYIKRANDEAKNHVDKLDGFQLLGRKIAHALGFSSDEKGDEQFKQFLGAVQSSLDSVFSAISAKIENQIKENQAWIDDIQNKRKQLEEELDIEKQRREEGLANNVGLKEEELKTLAKQEAEAMKEQEELRKKAVAAQLIQDGISQFSNLLTAVSGIIAGFSDVPLFGLALGIAAAATLFTFFATAKAKSREAVRGSSGGALADILGPNASTEDRYGVGEGSRVHPDLIANAREYLVNGDSTLANLSHLNKLNDGIYDGVDLDGFLSNFSPAEIADGFATRQTNLDAYKGLSQQRNFRHTMAAVMGGFTSAVVREIRNKPYAVAYSPGDHIRTISGDNVSDIVTAPAEPGWDR